MTFSQAFVRQYKRYVEAQTAEYHDQLIHMARLMHEGIDFKMEWRDDPVRILQIFELPNGQVEVFTHQ